MRLAPEYLCILEEKTNIGWICGQENQISKVARFTIIIVDLSENVLPKLELDSANKEAARRLSTCGEDLRPLSSRFAIDTLVEMISLARPLSTTLVSTARQVIRNQQAPAEEDI